MSVNEVKSKEMWLKGIKGKEQKLKLHYILIVKQAFTERGKKLLPPQNSVLF